MCYESICCCSNCCLQPWEIYVRPQNRKEEHSIPVCLSVWRKRLNRCKMADGKQRENISIASLCVLYLIKLLHKQKRCFSHCQKQKKGHKFSNCETTSEQFSVWGQRRMNQINSAGLPKFFYRFIGLVRTVLFFKGQIKWIWLHMNPRSRKTK